MPHLHYCDIGGHEYECEKSSCQCICGVSIQEGNHADCPVELLACPAHQEEEHKRMGGLPPRFAQDAALLGYAHGPQAVPLIDLVLLWLASRDDEH